MPCTAGGQQLAGPASPTSPTTSGGAVGKARLSPCSTPGLCVATKLAIRHQTLDLYRPPLPNPEPPFPNPSVDPLHQTPPNPFCLMHIKHPNLKKPPPPNTMVTPPPWIGQTPPFIHLSFALLIPSIPPL